MDEFVRQRLHELMSAAAANIAKAVHPIYHGTVHGTAEHGIDDSSQVERAAPSTKTAAHVIDANKTASLHIPVKGKLRKLEGSGVLTTAPGRIRDRDQFDFCVMDLSKELVRDFGNIRYVEEHEVVSAAVPRGHAYLAFGYPRSKNKPDHANAKIVPRRFSYGGPLAATDQSPRDHDS